jgi:hypothetical protein
MAQEEGRRARRRKPSKSVEQLKAEISARDEAKAQRAAERAAARRPLTPGEQHDRDKARRNHSGTGYSQHLMGGSKNSTYTSRRSTIGEEVLSYLLDEGFASDEKSAEAIMGAMSEAWVESIVEEVLNERKYEYDEKLPSGKTPRQKAERKSGYHSANYLLRGRETRDRNDQARTSHFNRGSTINTVIQSMDAGEEPRKDPKWKNTIAARRRPRSKGEVPNERPGGLRASNTKAGGHRTLKRKED